MRARREQNERLAKAMHEAGYPPATVRKAREGLWSDFESPLAFPKMELVEVLRRHGDDELVQRVIAGEFDG